MRTSIALIAGVYLTTVQPAWSDEKPVVATVESTMASDLPQVRQLAFDGDPSTFFGSKTPPKAVDSFTMTFDEPVVIKSIEVLTGKPDGSDKLEHGTLEGSTDGKDFQNLAKFDDGSARAGSAGKTLKAIRIKPSTDMDHSIAIQEIKIDSDRPVATFAYPVEFVVNVDDAPEMRDWADDVARLCERWYAPLNEIMKSEGYKPSKVIYLTMKKDYDGVAEASGNRIKGSVAFFTAHPDDKGAMIHETIHVIQRYRGRNPGWLVEGVADYLRFWVFEPGKAGPVNPRRARYDASYRTTATFLAYVTEKYDKELVSKLNVLMREGKYKESTFKDITGKTVQELGQEWKDSLGK